MTCKSKDFLDISNSLDLVSKLIEIIVKRKLRCTIDLFPKLKVAHYSNFVSKVIEIKAIVLDELVPPFVKEATECVILSREGIFYIPRRSLVKDYVHLGSCPDWDSRIAASIFWIEYGRMALVKMKELESKENCKCGRKCFYEFFYSVRKFFIMWRIARAAHSQK